MIKKLLITAIILIICSGSTAGQSVSYTMFKYNGFIPIVRVNEKASSLQSSLFPDMYNFRSVERDMQWVAENDSVLVSFWYEKGDTILHVLRELSGLEWFETEFDIYILKFFTSRGSGNPVVIPIGGIAKGDMIEAPPEGNRLKLNLIYQMARRMLDQPWRDEDSSFIGFMQHPLLVQSPYRRDNLALLLAVSAGEMIMGLDSLAEAYNSPFWNENFSGRTIFEEYFYNKWILTPSYSLRYWVEAEPWNSKLIRGTRLPRKISKENYTAPQLFVEGLPVQGQFGFSIRINEQNNLEIDKIDQYRLGYACGLREGDKIRRVDGKLVRTHKALVEKILETFEKGGTTVQIVRDSETLNIIIQPMILPEYKDDEYLDDYMYDTLEIQDTAINYDN